MKGTRYNIFAWVLFFIAPLFIGCSEEVDNGGGDEDPSPVVDLILDQRSASLSPEGSVTLRITRGNGDYRVTTSDAGVVKAVVNGDEITLTAGKVADKSEALVVITDKRYKRAIVEVDVANEFDLSLDKDEVELVVGVKRGSEVAIIIESGNFGYVLQPLGDTERLIEIDQTNLETAGKFVLKALEAGSGEIKVTDRQGKEAVLKVTIVDPPALTLDKQSLSIDPVQGTEYLHVTEGSGGYRVVFEDPSIAKTGYVTEGGVISIIGKRRGTTAAYVEDSNGLQSLPFTVEVSGPVYSMMLGEDYYGYADFNHLEQVDPALTKSHQVTFEMRCYMTGYRGGQTFMGLNDNLLLRGPNDDYRPTHPIAIVGDGLEIESSISFSLNEWTHIALVVDTDQQDVTEKYLLYVNGVQDQAMTFKNTSKTHNEINLGRSGDANKFVVGWATDQYWCRMLGGVSEVRVWKSARTQQQIKDNMEELADADSGDLFARWDFSAGVPTDYIQDTGNSGHEINLTLSKVEHGNKHYRPEVVPIGVYY